MPKRRAGRHANLVRAGAKGGKADKANPLDIDPDDPADNAFELVIRHNVAIARALQITGYPVSRQALHERVKRHRANAAAIEKKEEDAAKTLLVLGSSSQEDPNKFAGIPKLADPSDLFDGGSDDEDGDEDRGTDERDTGHATKKKEAAEAKRLTVRDKLGNLGVGTQAKDSLNAHMMLLRCCRGVVSLNSPWA